MRAALDAVDPGLLVERALGPDDLHVPPERSVTLIAAGKAACGMAAAAGRRLGPRVRRGIVVGPEGSDWSMPAGDEKSACPQFMVGGHPVPTPASEQAGRGALARAGATAANEALLVLLSGGASALMAVPAEGVTLEEKARTTDVLLRAGADIAALNTVRKHLSGLKGGRLAVASAAASLTLAISDVVGDDLSVIASGPTIADPTTFADALDVLQRWGGLSAYPPAVASRLLRGSRGELEETPKPGDPRLARSRARVIAGRHTAMRGANEEARRRGYAVRIVDRPITGEAREAARVRVADAAVEAAAEQRPCCLISSGETTVRVTGSGRGGRNQEFALAAAAVFAPLGPAAVLASLGTDGVDGPTDAAGAIVDSTTIERGRRLGLAVEPFLDNNDAFAFLQATGDLIRTGPTGTNVGDLQVILVA